MTEKWSLKTPSGWSIPFDPSANHSGTAPLAPSPGYSSEVAAPSGARPIVPVDEARVREIVREALAADRRERFIAAALTGLCANPDFGSQPRHFAEEAIIRADAVIAELEKGQT